MNFNKKYSQYRDLSDPISPLIAQDKQYNKGIAICCIIFMLIPLFNFIFGLIGIKKYPKKESGWLYSVSLACFIIGIIMFIAGASSAASVKNKKIYRPIKPF